MRPSPAVPFRLRRFPLSYHVSYFSTTAKSWRHAPPRYSGISTFFGTPHIDMHTEQGLHKIKAEVDIAVVGVPYDGGVTNRPGTRFGPREVRSLSVNCIRKVNQATGMAPFDCGINIADVGDAYSHTPFELEASLRDIEEHFVRLGDAGATTVAVGGDHSISLPILRALKRTRLDGPIGMVHIDAHCDTGADYAGSRFHHGSPFKVAVDEGILDPKRVIQIGIRGSIIEKDMWKFSHETGMRVMYMDECRDINFVLQEIERVVGCDRPTYVTFDIDALDPAFAPGTGTPEVGGFSTREALQIIRGISGMGCNIIGADCVEVSPPWDHAGITSLAGANITFELLCVVAKACVLRKRVKQPT